MRLGEKEPIHWCTKNTPGTNPMKLKKKGISPNGTVAEISLATGKTITKLMGNAYAQLKEYEKPIRGWVWYHECTKRCEPVPAADVLTSKGKTWKDLKLCEECAKRENLIAVRQATKTASTKEYLAQFATANDKLTDVLAKMVDEGHISKDTKLSDDQMDQLMARVGMPETKATRKTKLRTQKEVDADTSK